MYEGTHEIDAFCTWLQVKRYAYLALYAASSERLKV